MLIAYGLAFALFAWTRDLLVALIAQLVIGYCYFAIMTGLQTLIQQLVDESKRGRVMRLFQVCWAGLVPFGSLAMGYVAALLGTPLTMGLAALVCIAYGIVVAVFFHRGSAVLTVTS